MILSDRDIRGAIAAGQIAIEPLPEVIQPSSVDLTLGNRLLKLRYALSGMIRPHRAEQLDYEIHLLEDGSLDQPAVDRFDSQMHPMQGVRKWMWLQPGEFLLGTTQQRVSIGSGFCAQVEGKSSLGRIGLSIHTTAGFIDPGFEGEITLELHNSERFPILLEAGMPIAQLVLHQLSSPCENPYGTAGLGSHYQHQTGPTPTATRYRD